MKRFLILLIIPFLFGCSPTKKVEVLGVEQVPVEENNLLVTKTDMSVCVDYQSYDPINDVNKTFGKDSVLINYYGEDGTLATREFVDSFQQGISQNKNGMTLSYYGGNGSQLKYKVISDDGTEQVREEQIPIPLTLEDFKGVNSDNLLSNRIQELKQDYLNERLNTAKWTGKTNGQFDKIVAKTSYNQTETGYIYGYNVLTRNVEGHFGPVTKTIDVQYHYTVRDGKIIFSKMTNGE